MTDYSYKQLFPIYQTYPDLVYCDSASTTLKPKLVIDAITHYYTKVSCNIHRGDYFLCQSTYQKYWTVKTQLAKLLNAVPEEIIFTSGTTMGVNLLAQMLVPEIPAGSEIILSNHEHASNFLPWLELANKNKLQITIINYENDQQFLQELKIKCSAKTKVLSLAYITNSWGIKFPVSQIRAVIGNDCFFMLDIAQAICHEHIDLTTWGCDGAVLSAHKMFGPTGIGALFLSQKWHNKLRPSFVGGGMNISISRANYQYSLAKPPLCYEAGTVDVAGIYGWEAAINFIWQIGIKNIKDYISWLTKILSEKLAKISSLQIIYPNSNGIILCKLLTANAQDVATQLSTNNICVRSGHNCAKIWQNEASQTNTIRISLNIYNDLKDIQKIWTALQTPTDNLDAFFNNEST